jgi:hypothetical protein
MSYRNELKADRKDWRNFKDTLKMVLKVRPSEVYTFYTVHYGKLLKKRPTNTPVV